MTQPKANKVSEPGPSWEKELLTAAVDNFKEENPHLANDEYYHKADKSMTIRSFIKGARWAQERAAAPGEESWEKTKGWWMDLSLEELREEFACLEEIEVDNQKVLAENGHHCLQKSTDALWGLINERDELKAELSSLKATEASLREDLKTQRELRRDWERISDNHKALLAEATKALEHIADKKFSAAWHGSRQMYAERQLAKLKAPSDKDAGEGK